MSAPVAASAYWRIAGMSYLKYANLCADMVRSAVKPGPTKEAAKSREVVYYKSSVWENGKPSASGPPLPLSLERRLQRCKLHGLDPSLLCHSLWLTFPVLP